MYLNKSEKIQVGDTIKLKNGIMAKVVNINEFREPSMKYAIDIEGFNDVVFIGDLNIDTVLYDRKEVQQMSEEEIFECLNYVIDRWTNEKDITGVNYTAKCIKELIKLYQKEKEKNKELENIKANTTIVHNSKEYNIWLKENYVNKDRIRAKIEELEKREQELTDEQGYWRK